MMDLMELIDPMEQEFIELVEAGHSKETFLDSAKLIIGDDWEEVGRDIIKEQAPKLMKQFEAYANEETAQGD